MTIDIVVVTRGVVLDTSDEVEIIWYIIVTDNIVKITNDAVVATCAVVVLVNRVIIVITRDIVVLAN